jgi:hypothetical protein
LELLSQGPAYRLQYVPLYWDLEGSQDAEGLKVSLLECVVSAEERLNELDLEFSMLRGGDVFESLMILKRHARIHGRRLLLLCDECEELLFIKKNSPEVLPRLRRVFQEGEAVATVLTATTRLNKLQSGRILTSPFLHGFVPPSYLTPLQDSEAAELIGMGRFGNAIVGKVMRLTNNHPYLVQLVCKRLFDDGNLDVAVSVISSDENLAHFFRVDYECLSSAEQHLMRYVCEHDSVSEAQLGEECGASVDEVRGPLSMLSRMGYLRNENGGYRIGNYFFENWLKRECVTESRPHATSTESTRSLDLGDEPRDSKRRLAKQPSDRGQNRKGLFAAGAEVGRYVILERIGSGGVGDVYRARDSALGRDVAIKMLAVVTLEDPKGLGRFEREARAAGSLAHPNLLAVYDVGTHSGIPYIVSELLNGASLREKLSYGPFPASVAVRYALQLLNGLAAAHKKRIVHRDVKPENLFVTGDGVVKIIDFGLAKLVHSQRGDSLTKSGHTETGSIVGTINYMSPEQVRAGRVDVRSDLFSVGCVLYEMLSGRQPFRRSTAAATMNAILHESPPKLGSLAENVPPRLEHTVARCLEKNPAKRFQSAVELAVDIQSGHEFMKP